MAKTKKKTTKKTPRKSPKKTAKKNPKKVVKKIAKKIAKKTANKPTAARKTVKKTIKKSVKSTENSAALLKVGSQVPDFKVASTEGPDFQLSAHRGKKIVLYFYPKDSTPGCTIEGNEFTNLIGEFKAQGTEVYGISRDSLKSHDSFKSNQCFGFDLLSDPDEKLCFIFDVIKEKNMYGKMVMGVERSTFLLDENGKLVAEWRKVKAEGHAQEVLDKVKSLGQ